MKVRLTADAKQCALLMNRRNSSIAMTLAIVVAIFSETNLHAAQVGSKIMSVGQLDTNQIAAINELTNEITQQGTPQYSATFRHLVDLAGRAQFFNKTGIYLGSELQSPTLTKFDFDSRYTARLRALVTGGGRIWVPQAAAAGEFPQVVAVIDASGDLCTGTVIAKSSVLTAAHCACVPTPRHVVIGNNAWAFESTVVTRAYVPDGIDCANLESGSADVSLREFAKGDVGILVLQSPVSIQPSPLALESALQQGSTGTIVGFGKTDTGVLGVKNRADTLIVSDRCSGYVNGESDSTYYGCVSGREIVAQGPGHVDTCSGDSGGPLFVPTRNGHDDLIAVTSRGIATPGAQVCGDGGIYARIDASLTWIKNHVPDVVVDH